MESIIIYCALEFETFPLPFAFVSKFLMSFGPISFLFPFFGANSRENGGKSIAYK